MSQGSTAYLTEKCEVQNRDVTGGKAVYARDTIEPGELIAVWSGRIIPAEALDELPEEIRRHTVQVEESLYLASISPDEPPDFINHSCEPNAGLDGQIVIVALHRIHPGEEVTIDYAMCDGTPYDEFECACGTPFLPRPRDRRGLAQSRIVGALRRTFLTVSRAPHQGAEAAASPAQAQPGRGRHRGCGQYRMTPSTLHPNQEE